MKNKRHLRSLSIVILLLNGIPALLAGGSLILEPSGAGLLLDVGILESSPFLDFLIPGIILFIVNGLFSMFTLAMVLLNKKIYPLLISAQGIVLTGWIAIQILLITDPSWLQLAYGFAGLALIAAGLSLENRHARKNKVSNQVSMLPAETEAHQ